MLCKRLALAADLIKPGESVADIGADHARLAIYLAEHKIASRVIIGELSDGPFACACRAVQESALADKISLRQGNGLQVLDSGEVNNVIIAGLGGDTIVEILAYDGDKAASFQRFIFQPMSKARALRQWLANRGWVIEDERLVRENRRVYLVIVSRPGNCPYVLTDLEIDIGPLILKEDNEINRGFIQRYLQKYKHIYVDLMRSPLPKNSELAHDYRKKIVRLEEILGVSQD
jgi:tRNA (adenine22-N1)-methyltransferase